MNGSKYFSKIDLKQAYHQVELDPESRFITTFLRMKAFFDTKDCLTVHRAVLNYSKISFSGNLNDIKNVKNITDDIIILGKNRQENDTVLESCLKRLSALNINAKGSKCSSLKAEIKFYGLIFTEKGTRPYPDRVAKLQNVAPPQTAHEVRSFPCMGNTCSDYIPNYAAMTLPLREVTKKYVEFKWTPVEQRSFNELKQKLTQAPVMAYFDTQKRSMLIFDGSPTGISGILTQRDNDKASYKAISYASPTLALSCHYSQRDIERLVLVWAIEHLRLFLLGTEFDVVTDQKALEAVFNNPKSKPPARIERWILRLQQCNFRAIYKSGMTNEADYLSRYPIDITKKERLEEHIAELYTFYIASQSIHFRNR